MLFTQVKLATSDPERLARFYEEALECEVVVPLTKLREPAWRGIGGADRDVSILVMSLPDAGEDGPTLELITGTGLDQAVGMLAFFVDDVDQSVETVLAAGGSLRGEVVDFVGPSGRRSRFVFMSDPEGNIIDIYGAAPES